MVQCTLSLIALHPGDAASDFLTKAGSGIRLITGVPHGWVLQPHSRESKSLVGREWDLFVLTEASDQAFETAVQNFAAAYVKATVSIPAAQYDDLLANVNKKATPAKETPPLPKEFSDGKTGQVPKQHILPAKDGPLEPGELKLYEPMATFLSSALPATVRDKPVSLFNLFKYRNGDPNVHEHYMQGFKEKFGPAAGAQLKFMGPVVSQPEYVEGLQTESRDAKMGWQDANIVQYDSIWHYVYMLSTDVYQELNKEKVRGLEDTCILLVSEIELQE